MNKKIRISFWKGLLHALAIVLYVMFISLVWISVSDALQAVYTPIINVVFGLFVLILSFGICAYFLFFEPFKLIVHKHFKPASVLIASTFGWLFVFLIVFLIGFIQLFI